MISRSPAGQLATESSASGARYIHHTTVQCTLAVKMKAMLCAFGSSTSANWAGTCFGTSRWTHQAGTQ